MFVTDCPLQIKVCTGKPLVCNPHFIKKNKNCVPLSWAKIPFIWYVWALSLFSDTKQKKIKNKYLWRWKPGGWHGWINQRTGPVTDQASGSVFHKKLIFLLLLYYLHNKAWQILSQPLLWLSPVVGSSATYPPEHPTSTPLIAVHQTLRGLSRAPLELPISHLRRSSPRKLEGSTAEIRGAQPQPKKMNGRLRLGMAVHWGPLMRGIYCLNFLGISRIFGRGVNGMDLGSLCSICGPLVSFLRYESLTTFNYLIFMGIDLII